MYVPHECTALSPSGTSLSAVGAFFTLNRIPTRHNSPGQDATNGSPPRKSEVLAFHILVCTRRMCLQHCMVMTRVTPALDGERLTPCLRRVNAHGLISTTHLVVSADLLQYVSLATCALVMSLILRVV